MGYAEKVYERAMVYELRQRGLKVEEQRALRVMYNGGIDVGDFMADVVVEDKVILELKATSCITSEHAAQLIIYLTATGMLLGYVMNFSGDRTFGRRIGLAAWATNYHSPTNNYSATTLHDFACRVKSWLSMPESSATTLLDLSRPCCRVQS